MLFWPDETNEEQVTHVPNPEGKQDLSDSAGGIGGALAAPTHAVSTPASSNNNNNNNCDDDTDTATAAATSPPSSPAMGNGGGGSSSGGDAATDQPPQQTTPKWPVKPGVHLHVNGLHSLGKSVKPINGFSYGTKPSTSTLPLPSSNDPSPAHRKGDLNDDGKAFYENLPFHGLQSPQSKSVGDVRPPSELSQTGSSGYGSTRSQKNKGAAAAANAIAAAGTSTNTGAVVGMPLSSGATSLETQSGSNQITSTTPAPGDANQVTTAQAAQLQHQQQLTGNAQQEHQHQHQFHQQQQTKFFNKGGVGGTGVKSKAPPPPPLPPPNPHSPALKPVNIVKPTTEEQQQLPVGPKTSTPIKANQSIQSFSYISESTGYSPCGDEHAGNFNQHQQLNQLHASPISNTQMAPFEWTSTLLKNGRNNQMNDNHNRNNNNNRGKPLVDARAHSGNTNANSHPVKLATVRPQRIASVSGGSFRPFRMPEAPRILFRSVRGKSSSASNIHNNRHWAPGAMGTVAAGPMGFPDNPPYQVPVISRNLSKSCKEVYKPQRDLSIDTDFSGGGVSGGAPLFPTNIDNGGCNSAPAYSQGSGDSIVTVQPSLLPQNSDELEAITLANTIANKNANKISPISSGSSSNYSQNHAQHHLYATISPPSTPGGSVVMGTTALAKRAAAVAAAASSSKNNTANSVSTTAAAPSSSSSINRAKPPISTKPTSINSINVPIIPPPTSSSSGNKQQQKQQQGISSAAPASANGRKHSGGDSSTWKKSSLTNQQDKTKRNSGSGSKKSSKSGGDKKGKAKSGGKQQKGIEMSSIVPPPLIGNKHIPPPPMLDDDEDEEEETEALGSSSSINANNALHRKPATEGNENDSSNNDDNNNLTLDEDDEEEDELGNDDDETQWLTEKKPSFYGSVKSSFQQPLAAPRIQAKNSKHVYQNIPFTKKTPLHEV
ncbi:unnamed protein product [Orchesella dallaii]|uniref:Uncharacterized protein n=1 Tax=Orchesella dallaii TaxID=48710 RepID=A0ABP1QS61_9HEXA